VPSENRLQAFVTQAQRGRAWKHQRVHLVDVHRLHHTCGLDLLGVKLTAAVRLLHCENKRCATANARADEVRLMTRVYCFVGASKVRDAQRCPLSANAAAKRA